MALPEQFTKTRANQFKAIRTRSKEIQAAENQAIADNHQERVEEIADIETAIQAIPLFHSFFAIQQAGIAILQQSYPRENNVKIDQSDLVTVYFQQLEGEGIYSEVSARGLVVVSSRPATDEKTNKGKKLLYMCNQNKGARIYEIDWETETAAILGLRPESLKKFVVPQEGKKGQVEEKKKVTELIKRKGKMGKKLAYYEGYIEDEFGRIKVTLAEVIDKKLLDDFDTFQYNFNRIKERGEEDPKTLLNFFYGYDHTEREGVQIRSKLIYEEEFLTDKGGSLVFQATQLAKTALEIYPNQPAKKKAKKPGPVETAG